MAEGQWNGLPDLVISHLFSYLSLNECIQACAVCKTWAKGIESPHLWKSVSIYLNGELEDVDQNRNTACGDTEQEEEEDANEDTEEPEPDYKDLEKVEPKRVRRSTLSFSNEKALRFAKRHGNFLKNLCLMCDPVSGATSDVLRCQVSQFLKNLVESSCELTELVVFFSYNVDDWDLVSRKELIDAFCEFFENQKRIETLIFCNYITGEEVRLLEAVAKGSRTTLKNFHCMFYSDDGEESKYQETYRQVLSDLSFLQYLSISYNSLNNETITILNNCKRLKAIYLYDLGPNREIPWRPVFPAYDIDWKKPLKIHPQVEDSIEGEYWLKCPKFEEFLPIKASVYANRLFNFEEEHQIIEIVKHLGEKFPKNLACLSITDRHSLGNKRLEKAITKLLCTCTELKELKLALYDPHELLEDICKLQFQNKIDLQSLWFLCLDCGSLDLDKLKAICKQYCKLISDRNWDLVVQKVRFKLTEFGLQYLAEQEQASAENPEEQLPEELDDQDTGEQQQSDDQDTAEEHQEADQDTAEQHQEADQDTAEQHQEADQDTAQQYQEADQDTAQQYQEADQDTAQQHQEGDQDTAQQHQEADEESAEKHQESDQDTADERPDDEDSSEQQQEAHQDSPKQMRTTDQATTKQHLVQATIEQEPVDNDTAGAAPAEKQ